MDRSLSQPPTPTPNFKLIKLFLLQIRLPKITPPPSPSKTMFGTSHGELQHCGDFAANWKVTVLLIMYF